MPGFPQFFKMIRRGNVEESPGPDRTLIDWDLLHTPPLVICDDCGRVERCSDKFSLPDKWAGTFYFKRHLCPSCGAKQ